MPKNSPSQMLTVAGLCLVLAGAEFPGEHEWTFWEAALPVLLRSLARRLPDVAGIDLR